MLRRLKGLGASEDDLLDVYSRQVSSLLELSVPVWQPDLTLQEANQIEGVQWCAFYIILGVGYVSHANALDTLVFEDLNTRRIRLCSNFVKKSVKNPRYNNWFSKNVAVPPPIGTRPGTKKDFTEYQPVRTRTDRFRKSPLPYLTELLNTVKKQ